MKNTYSSIPTEQIAFDEENPRIKVALEKYGDKLDEARIRFALQTATEGSSTTSSYRALKDSIRASRGISVPIVVSPDADRFVCIDGNTRLAIYNELRDENAPGDWTTINCLVLDDPSQRDIETVRVTAHLVGAREWPAYEKARYLHYLRNVEFMDYDELIARCGGNKTTITQQIEAFHEMNEFYRDVSSDDAFKVDRFSGFVELQKRGVKDSIFTAGFGLHDFGKWIRNGQIFRLADVRKLPLVLADDQAKDVFVDGGLRSIENAIEVAQANRRKDVQPSPRETPVANASMATLAEALLDRIKSLPREDYVALRDRQYETADQDVDILSDLAEHLHDLLQDVSK
ncbi:ParB N-terminal domain-containing protein [Candidatus Palauibacter sp.]|uniref:ParB N-terminal domain-containing protein n=1 Tax=Candidatus Palauibacter sp. TaxID=3101350 RepID=UPI003B5CEC1E